MTLFKILSLYEAEYSGDYGYFFDIVTPSILKDLQDLEKLGLITIDEPKKLFYLTETGRMFREMDKL